MTTGEKIGRIRKGNNFTQEQFAEILGVSRQTVYRWENNKITPSKEKLQVICSQFGVDLSVFYNTDDTVDNNFEMYEYEDYKTKNKEKDTKKLLIFTALIMAVIINAVFIRTEAKISKLENTINEMETTVKYLKKQNDSLNMRLTMLIDTPQTERYIFFDYEVLEYNRKTNMIKLQIQVTPADFTGNTTAHFTTDTAEGSFIADTVYTDHVYTGIIDSYRQEDMPLYMYLTDNGRVRSFLVDYLPDLTEKFKLDFGYCGIAGGEDFVLENGRFSTGNARLDVSLLYRADPQNKDRMVYPVKADVEIYVDDILLKVKPFDNLVNVDYSRLAQKSDNYRKDDPITYKHSAYLTLDEEFSGSDIKGNSDLKFILKITDNHGLEYQKTIVNGY